MGFLNQKNKYRLLSMSKLYIVATPIGNLEDITLRALRVLRDADVIACEDTRHTGNLLSHFEIKKRLIATHSHNERESSKGILALLDEGKDVAYCSDAGTPGVSDPGEVVVDYVRSNSSHEVIPVPGPSAFVALLSVAGVVGKSCTFEGFLSPKSGRRKKRLEELIARNEPFIIYESPFRVLKTLKEAYEIDSCLSAVMGREITKQFEEIRKDTLDGIIRHLEQKDSIKGEFAVLFFRSNDDKAEEDQDS